MTGAVALVAGLGVPARAVITPPAPYYQPVTVHTHHFDDDQRFGERTEVAGDHNKDGVNDVWIGVPSYDRDDKTYGKVFLYDGKSLADPQGNKDKPKPLKTIHYPEPQIGKQFGFWIENIGDVNLDGLADLAVGTDAQDVPWDPTENSQNCVPHPERCNQNQGKVWVFDGNDNKVLYELHNPRPQGTPSHRARFGSRIGTVGDVNGNGISDIIVGASGNDNPESWTPANGGDGCSDDGIIEPGCRNLEGQAFVFEGAPAAHPTPTSGLIAELKLPDADENPPTTCASSCGSLGLAVQGPGDVDGDGRPDALVDAGTYTVGANVNQGRMYVYSGAAIAATPPGVPLGEVIRRIDNPVPQAGATFGFQDVTHRDPGDVNQDGRADIYGNGFTQHGKTGVFDAGRAWVFNGGAGTPLETPVLYELSGHPNEAKYGAQCCWSMTRDRNRVEQRGLADDENPATNPLYVGAAPHHAPSNPDQSGDTYTFNAATGTMLQHLDLPPPWNTEVPPNQRGLGPNLGWTVSSPGDLNGDGFRDFVAGAPFTDVCEKLLGSTNKKLNPNQGIIITFRSTADPNNTQPVNNSSDKNPADNQCEPANNN